MRLSRINRIDQLYDKVSELIQALTNRLTARDNWGPEGEVGQVLVSRGPRDVDPPPHFADISELITDNPEMVGPQGPQGEQGEQGEDGADGPEGPAGFMPTYIAEGETFTIPANRQGLYALPIVNDGNLVITGDLIMVD